ncbi:MAG: STAS domain-containing protein [Dactylosporangium sp.]|nr:STAS domain-containing protein [Dactylosporangium sp.]NNJ62010.1 STAS domain-containing protein [Dactylosporangium sp.]
MSSASVQTCLLADGATQIRPVGVIAGDAVDRLRRTLIEVLLRQRPARIVIDLSDANVVDPVALGSLMAATDAAQDLGIELTVHGADLASVPGWNELDNALRGPVVGGDRLPGVPAVNS